MPFDRVDRHALLRDLAPGYLDLAIENIEREFPHMPWLVVTGPGTLPGHRDLHPCFFGSFDWHSCVEMYWVAVRLMRLHAGLPGEAAARELIGELLIPANVAAEARFFDDPGHRGFERPYGWGWLLTLQAELDGWDDPDGRAWAGNLRPLSETIAGLLLAWLPLLTYPQRVGMHANTAFGLLRSLDFATTRARDGDEQLLEAIRTAATRMFLHDMDYPARYEPSGADFLSPALTEAELMARLLPELEFPSWLESFLPGLAEQEPMQLFTPAVVSDISDGQIAHLAGLNLSRAASFLAIVNALPERDPRVPPLTAAAERHAGASLSLVRGGGYMAEHWLSAYATLVLSP